ncbi:MAG: hypothetical protein MI923_20300 [Phycisphaerales bacterium]|nr:hypothetical protein [Phycisphaerales bacterium]
MPSRPFRGRRRVSLSIEARGSNTNEERKFRKESQEIAVQSVIGDLAPGAQNRRGSWHSVPRANHCPFGISYQPLNSCFLTVMHSLLLTGQRPT